MPTAGTAAPDAARKGPPFWHLDFRLQPPTCESVSSRLVTRPQEPRARSGEETDGQHGHARQSSGCLACGGAQGTRPRSRVREGFPEEGGWAEAGPQADPWLCPTPPVPRPYPAAGRPGLNPFTVIWAQRTPARCTSSCTSSESKGVCGGWGPPLAYPQGSALASGACTVTSSCCLPYRLPTCCVPCPLVARGAACPAAEQVQEPASLRGWPALPSTGHQLRGGLPPSGPRFPHLWRRGGALHLRASRQGDGCGLRPSLAVISPLPGRAPPLPPPTPPACVRPGFAVCPEPLIQRAPRGEGGQDCSQGTKVGATLKPGPPCREQLQSLKESPSPTECLGCFFPSLNEGKK